MHFTSDAGTSRCVRYVKVDETQKRMLATPSAADRLLEQYLTAIRDSANQCPLCANSGQLGSGNWVVLPRLQSTMSHSELKWPGTITCNYADDIDARTRRGRELRYQKLRHNDVNVRIFCCDICVSDRSVE